MGYLKSPLSAFEIPTAIGTLEPFVFILKSLNLPAVQAGRFLILFVNYSNVIVIILREGNVAEIKYRKNK